MKQIIAAIAMDKSDSYVIEKSEEIAKRTGAKIIYVHAAEVRFFEFLGSKTKNDEDKIKSEVLKSINKISRVKDSNVVVSFGSAWELILKTSKFYKADLVVLGNMGKAKAVFYLGSTAKKVLEKIGIPVFIARNAPLDKKILIPTDLGDYTMKASEVKKFLESEAETTYVYANTVSFGITVPYTTLAVNSLEYVQDEIKKQITDFKKNRTDAPTVTLEIEESIADTINEYAKDNGYSLTVLASRNIAGLSPIIFGSTASKIAQSVNTNLLITFVNE